MRTDVERYEADGVALYQCDYATLAEHMREAGIVADALIVDAPYSERTHSGHTVSRDDGAGAREIEYSSWNERDVAFFVALFASLTRGWIASLTDHSLCPSWEAAYERAGRYAFAPLPCVERGMTVRLTGDGPSSWTTYACVSRRASREWAAWGTLPGAYVGPSERKPVVGGKPLWLMRALVRDYSRPGDLVCDPCMGGGTTLVAAIEEGRRAIGCEPDAGRFAIAVKRCREAKRPLPGVHAPKVEQLGLGGT